MRFISFIIATIFALFFSALFPSFQLFFYIPFLIVCFFRSSFITSLWLGFLSGLIMDLVSSFHLGFHALILTLISLIFYNQKKYFKESAINIAIFTIIISIFYSFCQILMLYLFENKSILNLSVLFLDIFLMSLLDALYALIFFGYPFELYEQIKKGKFFQKNEE